MAKKSTPTSPQPPSWHPAPPRPPKPTGPVAAIVTVGRWCSSCRTVRPPSLFAPSPLTEFGILNYVCRVCDGTYVEPVDETAILQTQLAAYVRANDQLRGDVSALAAELQAARSQTPPVADTTLLERQIADLTYELQDAERTIAALRQPGDVSATLKADYDRLNQQFAQARLTITDLKNRLAARKAERPLRREPVEAVPSAPVRVTPLAERPAPPAIPASDEPVVIPATARTRVENFPQPNGEVRWVAYADEQPVGGGSAPNNEAAGKLGWMWIAEHRAPSPQKESAEKAQATKQRKLGRTPELEATT